MKDPQPLARLARYGSRTAFHLNSRARALLPSHKGRIRVTIESSGGGGIRIKPANPWTPGARLVNERNGQIIIPPDLLASFDVSHITWGLTKTRGGVLIGARQESK